MACVKIEHAHSFSRISEDKCFSAVQSHLVGSPSAKGMRLSMHPGQYTLPSAAGPVWERSSRDLCYHAFVLDQLGIEDGDLILHGGGVYGDRLTSIARIIENITLLPENVRRRLRLENDERSWSVDERSWSV